MKSSIYRILDNTWVYGRAQELFKFEPASAAWKSETLELQPKRVLDLGCGPGHGALEFPDSEYVGVDNSEPYIEAANREFAKRGQFVLADISKLPSAVEGVFDLVVLKGVFHHLSPNQVAETLAGLERVVTAHTRIVSIDPTRWKGQGLLSNLLVSMDRGNFVRTDSELEALVSQYCQISKSTIISQNFPPYSRLLMTMSYKNASAQ